MRKFRWSITLAVAFSLIIFSLNAALNMAWSGGLTPSEVVLKYYHALQKMDFIEASQCVSREMLADKNEGEWAAYMKNIFEMGKVVITEVSASPGPVSEQEAQVNTVITSKDALNKNGLIEHNVEYLVLEDGLWKVDRTELEYGKIMEPPHF